MSSSSVDKNLKKGYAIIKKDKNLIKSIKSLKSLNQFSVIMNDGKILIKK
jgi:exonuclease VII large subunit